MSSQPESTILVIFGSMGDLTWRKLAPAIYNLLLDKELPEHFALIGLDLKPASPEEFQLRLKDGTQHFCECGGVDERAWSKLATKFAYISGDFANPATYATLVEQIKAYESEWGHGANPVFYLATPPAIMETIVKGLGAVGLADDKLRARIVVEKPFGHDLVSAVELNALLTSVFDEKQIYRIDHYLGKETVQNILAFRFANAMFEPLWNRHYIDHIQITVSEEVGVGHRGAYYEHAGALRDMMQNHLIQIMTLVAMEPMVSFDADEIRNKKVDVLKAIRPITKDQVPQVAVRGQYGAGQMGGERVPAYRSEPGVSADSPTETFTALRLHIDNWRWQDVPFYLRTGKRLEVKSSEINIQFRPVPHQSFPKAAATAWQPNRLTLQIQPQEGILLHFQAKQPGFATHNLSPVNMRFSYQDAFKTKSPEAYQTLLGDVMAGDATLFMRADQVELSWALLMPVLDVWKDAEPTDFPNYKSGRWGPHAADALIAQDGRSWFEPSPSDDQPQGKLETTEGQD